MTERFHGSGQELYDTIHAKPETPAEQIARLTAEVERLKQEVQEANARAKANIDMVNEYGRQLSELRKWKREQLEKIEAA